MNTKCKCAKMPSAKLNKGFGRTYKTGKNIQLYIKRYSYFWRLYWITVVSVYKYLIFKAC